MEQANYRNPLSFQAITMYQIVAYIFVKPSSKQQIDPMIPIQGFCVFTKNKSKNCCDKKSHQKGCCILCVQWMVVGFFCDHGVIPCMDINQSRTNVLCVKGKNIISFEITRDFLVSWLNHKGLFSILPLYILGYLCHFIYPRQFHDFCHIFNLIQIRRCQIVCFETTGSFLVYLLNHR